MNLIVENNDEIKLFENGELWSFESHHFFPFEMKESIFNFLASLKSIGFNFTKEVLTKIFQNYTSHSLFANIFEYFGWNDLHFELQKQNVSSSKIKFLIDKKIDLNMKDRKGKTALHYASGNKNISKKIIKNILDENANVMIEDEKARIPLHIASIQNNTKCILLLICNYSDPYHKDKMVKKKKNNLKKKKSNYNFFF